MTPADWQAVLAKSGTITDTAAALGLNRDSVSDYAHGKPTPRKVALAVAAYMAGIEPYGERK